MFWITWRWRLRKIRYITKVLDPRNYVTNYKIDIDRFHKYHNAACSTIPEGCVICHDNINGGHLCNCPGGLHDDIAHYFDDGANKEVYLVVIGRRWNEKAAMERRKEFDEGRALRTSG
jgi:hypothetical protein